MFFLVFDFVTKEKIMQNREVYVNKSNKSNFNKQLQFIKLLLSMTRYRKLKLKLKKVQNRNDNEIIFYSYFLLFIGYI